MKSVVVYTDGSIKKVNPGPGGWACILRYGKSEKVLSGNILGLIGNNGAELTALLEALRALKEPCQVDFYSDSQYLVMGCNQWVHDWTERNWKNVRKRDIKNRILWEQLLEFKKVHQITGHWIRGHAGHAENEICHQLAKLAIP